MGSSLSLTSLSYWILSFFFSPPCLPSLTVSLSSPWPLGSQVISFSNSIPPFSVFPWLPRTVVITSILTPPSLPPSLPLSLSPLLFLQPGLWLSLLPLHQEVNWNYICAPLLPWHHASEDNSEGRYNLGWAHMSYSVTGGFDRWGTLVHVVNDSTSNSLKRVRGWHSLHCITKIRF